jgi:hypothetical protein
MPGFLGSVFLAVSDGTFRTYLEALARVIQAVDDPLKARLLRGELTEDP